MRRRSLAEQPPNPPKAADANVPWHEYQKVFCDLLNGTTLSDIDKALGGSGGMPDMSDLGGMPDMKELNSLFGDMANMPNMPSAPPAPPKPKEKTLKELQDEFKSLLKKEMPAEIVNFKQKGAKQIYEKSRSLVKPLNMEWLIKNDIVKFSSKKLTTKFVLFKTEKGIQNAFIGEHNEYN